MTASPDYFFLDGQKLVATDNGDGTKTLVVSGGGGGGSSGSVTAAGVSGTLAQAVQGITGGVPVPTLSSVPVASSATILALTTNATGATFTAFTAQACTALDIVNNTGTTVEYRRGGAGVAMQIPTGTARMVIAITNASQISVRRTDTSNTQVTLQAEAFVN